MSATCGWDCSNHRTFTPQPLFFDIWRVAVERTKNILELGHSEENKRDELESEELILSKKTQKEGDADDLVDTDTDTDTDTDMSETNRRDHGEKSEEKKEKIVTQK